MREGFVIYASPIVNPKGGIDYRCTICDKVYANRDGALECWKDHFIKLD
jgi:hypothetical protein